LDDAPPGDNVRNSASIPLELFNAEATNDKVSQPDPTGPNKLWNSTEKDEWHMKTVLGSEVTFQREWVDSRILEAPEQDSHSGDEDAESDGELTGQGVAGSSRGRQGSTSQANPSNKKRKASMTPIDEGMSDDDIQIIEGPTKVNPNQGTRQR
jgi:hypothetical protein